MLNKLLSQKMTIDYMRRLLINEIERCHVHLVNIHNSTTAYKIQENDVKSTRIIHTERMWNPNEKRYNFFQQLILIYDKSIDSIILDIIMTQLMLEFDSEGSDLLNLLPLRHIYKDKKIMYGEKEMNGKSQSMSTSNIDWNKPINK